MLFLPGPNKLRVEVRIVIQFLTRLYAGNSLNIVVHLVSGERRVGLWRDQTHGRIVYTLLTCVLIPLNVPFLRVIISSILPPRSRHLPPRLPTMISGNKRFYSEGRGNTSDQMASSSRCKLLYNRKCV